MLVMSHRGYCADQCENTLDAFRAAINLGVDGIETDVRLSADRLPVLCHDRVAPGGREVAMLSRRELEEVMGHPVPTLDEALDLWSGGLWNIEIKTPGALHPALSVLSDYALSHRILVTSFWHNIIQVAAQHGDFECGIIVANRPADYETLIALLDRLPSVRHMIWDYEIFDQDLVRLLPLSRGVINLAYGVEGKAEHEKCRSLGLGGVITDSPEFLIPA